MVLGRFRGQLGFLELSRQALFKAAEGAFLKSPLKVYDSVRLQAHAVRLKTNRLKTKTNKTSWLVRRMKVN